MSTIARTTKSVLTPAEQLAAVWNLVTTYRGERERLRLLRCLEQYDAETLARETFGLPVAQLLAMTVRELRTLHNWRSVRYREVRQRHPEIPTRLHGKARAGRAA